MGEWDGNERRGFHEPDWLQHKMSVLNDINALKQESKETKDLVLGMKVSFEVLKAKLATIMLIGGSTLGFIAGFVQDWLTK